MYGKKKTETADGAKTNRCARPAEQFGGLYIVAHICHVTSDADTPSTVLFLLHPILCTSRLFSKFTKIILDYSS